MDLLTYKVNTGLTSQLTRVTELGERQALAAWEKNGWNWECIGKNLPIETYLKIKSTLDLKQSNL